MGITEETKEEWSEISVRKIGGFYERGEEDVFLLTGLEIVFQLGTVLDGQMMGVLLDGYPFHAVEQLAFSNCLWDDWVSRLFFFFPLLQVASRRFQR